MFEFQFEVVDGEREKFQKAYEANKNNPISEKVYPLVQKVGVQLDKGGPIEELATLLPIGTPKEQALSFCVMTQIQHLHKRGAAAREWWNSYLGAEELRTQVADMNANGALMSPSCMSSGLSLAVIEEMLSESLGRAA